MFATGKMKFAKATAGGGVDADFIAHWEFDESSGTTAADSVGSYDATMTNGATFAAGKIGNAGSFDGFNDVALVSDDVALRIGTSDFSLAWWEKNDIDSGSNNNVRFDKGGVSGSGSIYFYQVNYRLRINGSDVFNGIGSTTIGAWTHLAIVRSSGTIRFYKNGSQLGGNYANTANINSSANIGIGAEPDGDRSFDGLLDDFRFYKRALSTGEITTLASV